MKKSPAEMETWELVVGYRISLADDEETLRIYNIKRCKEDNAVDVIRARKPEILDFLRRQKAAELQRQEAWKQEKEEERRKAVELEEKANAIPGLIELRSALNDLAKWNTEFDRSFDEKWGAGVGGLGVRSYPGYDIPAMKSKYPAAAAYLRAEEEAYSGNYELAAIGRRAMVAIAGNPSLYAEAMETMDAEIRDFCGRHIFD